MLASTPDSKQRGKGFQSIHALFRLMEDPYHLGLLQRLLLDVEHLAVNIQSALLMLFQKLMNQAWSSSGTHSVYKTPATADVILGYTDRLMSELSMHLEEQKEDEYGLLRSCINQYLNLVYYVLKVDRHGVTDLRARSSRISTLLRAVEAGPLIQDPVVCFNMDLVQGELAELDS